MTAEGGVWPQLLGNRYALSANCQQGAQVVVTQSSDTQLGRVVAIKRMRFGPFDQRAREGFWWEGQMLQELRHPNIVEMIAVDRGFWYLVLEWVSENLESFIRRGALTWDDFWERFGRPLLDAVVYVQKRRIAHRDIKPKNILITEVRAPIPQIILRWLVQQDDVVAFPRTTNPDRIAENLTVFDFELGEDEMGAISDIGKAQQPDRQPGRTGSRVGCFLIGRS